MVPGKFRLMRNMSTAAHWNEAYAQGERTRSWYQSRADMSLQLFDELGVEPRHSVIDVGGGASPAPLSDDRGGEPRHGVCAGGGGPSPLVDELLNRGHRTLCVLDVAESGVHIARARLGDAADSVEWVIADVLDWRPARRFDV